MAKSILLGLFAAAIIPLPVAEAVATKQIETDLLTRIKLNNNLVKSCSLSYQLDSCISPSNNKAPKSEVYSELWLKNIARVLLSGSMFKECKTTFKPQPIVKEIQSLEINRRSGSLGCIFSWQEFWSKPLESQQNQSLLSSNINILPKSDRFIGSDRLDKQEVAVKTPRKFLKLSRSSLMVSYPKSNSTFKPKETKLANPAPETKRIASPFGWRRRPYSYQIQFHQGIDYGAPLGSPVVAVGNGIVTKVVSGCYDFGNLFCGGQLGNWIEVDHGNGKLGIYGHLKNNSIIVQEGMKVRKNQEIAQVGSSGWSTGAHLDFRFKVNGEYEDPALYVTVPSF